MRSSWWLKWDWTLRGPGSGGRGLRVRGSNNVVAISRTMSYRPDRTECRRQCQNRHHDGGSPARRDWKGHRGSQIPSAPSPYSVECNSPACCHIVMSEDGAEVSVSGLLRCRWDGWFERRTLSATWYDVRELHQRNGDLLSGRAMRSIWKRVRPGIRGAHRPVVGGG